jgi:carboxyl-terminal processing protease
LPKRRVRSGSLLPVAILVLAVVAPPLPAAGLQVSPQQLRDQAREYEQRGQWTQACACYNLLLKTNHDAGDREHFATCLRHANQLRRHRDPDFAKNLRGRSLNDALDIYDEVLQRLLANYVERDKIRLTEVVRRGLEEFRFALEDDVFLHENLPQVPAARVRAFAGRLERRPLPEVQKIGEARVQVRGVAEDARAQLGLDQAAVVMEFAWGAGNALDDYTVLLTPSQFSFLQASMRGEIVGVGVKVGTADQKVVLTSVGPNSPAAEKGLKPNDQVVRIDGLAVDGWSDEAVATRLLGRVGTAVDLDVQTPDLGPRSVRLVRQPVLMPSVDWEPVPRDGVGYIRILTFQESTPQELKDALLQLQAVQMKALVLDLRGNSGGGLQAAVQVAELFLPDSVIASTESPLRRFRATYRAHNPHALTLPLVVLIDGETASAAEVVAGALKENQRATVVGAPSYGKGSIQCPVALDRMPAGLWITVAHFNSPSNQPYNGRGIVPHIREEIDVMGSQRESAWRVAQQLTMMSR